MRAQIDSSIDILETFTGAVDRKHIVAHAFLSALAHHWPSRTDKETTRLLERTSRIKNEEHSRWAVQRRIAISRLATWANSAD